MPLGGIVVTPEVLAGWEQDQLALLVLLAGFLSVPRPTVVQLRVIEAVRYQAAHGPRPVVRAWANAVNGLVANSFELRLTRLLLSRLARMDTWDDDRNGNDGRVSHDEFHTRHQQRHRAVAEEVWQQHTDAAAAFTLLETTVRALGEVEREVEPYHLLWYLLDLRPAEVIAFTELVLANPVCALASCFATCLAHARRVDPKAATALACRAVESDHPSLVIGAANHYCWDRSDQKPLSDADAAVVLLLVSSADPAVRTLGLGALHDLARTDPRAAVELALGVEVGGAEEVGEELARLTDPTQPATLAAALLTDDLRALTRKFAELPRVGYWVSVLARRMVTQMPDEVLDLFLRRIERLDGYGSSLDAIPYREIDGVFGPLSGHKRLSQLVRRVRDFALTSKRFQTFALGHLFRAVSLNFGSEGLAVLREWLDDGDPMMAEHAVGLLTEADPGFVFDQREFVTYLLARAEGFGQECLDRVRSAIRQLAVSGERFGTAGEPFPQDIAQRDRAVETLRELTPGTETYRLYEAIRRSADARVREESRDDEES